jgi:putative redox protein
MQESILVNWKEGLSFEADVMGFKINMDADPEHGGKGKGPKPKPLMMVALAGCTGMDVVSLMEKMRVPFEDLRIHVTGDITEEHPKKFVKMKITYEIYGKGLDPKKIEKAVNLSQDKYCGVSASYKDSMEITHEIKITETGN